MRQYFQDTIKALEERADYLSQRYLTNGGTRYHEEYTNTIVLIGQMKEYIVTSEGKYGDL